MYEMLWSEFELWMLLQSRPSSDLIAEPDSNFLQASVSNLRHESEMDVADLKTDIFVIRSEVKKTLTFLKVNRKRLSLKWKYQAI